MDTAHKIAELENTALGLGASQAKIIHTSDIQIREELAEFCKTCPSFGLALGCPPNVSGPEGFRQLCHSYTRALVFKYLVPVDILLSKKKSAPFRIVHETAARIEKEAVALGFSKATGFAGGSCKDVFCTTYPGCSALEQGLCRYPDSARASMSGFGIDVGALIQTAGWDKESFLGNMEFSGEEMAGIYGLVLVD